MVSAFPDNLASLAASPSVLLIFERRLAAGAYLMLNPVVAYRRTTVNDVREEVLTTAAIQGHFGVRWVANPEAPVEVGLAHVVTPGYSRATFEGKRFRAENPEQGVDSGAIWSETTEHTYGIGLGNSLVVERLLVDRLWLRIAVDLLAMNYSVTELEAVYEDDLAEDDDSSKVYVGFEPGTSLTLRLAF